ncbi:DoxX family membrane protein [Kribbella sp. VKM Ac-2568]|uniref:DoxX family membrane protein n=1 Tax=Kribbella sp. VKM Ac-2568 TaxID=2512219 RepID=UPI00104DB42D|nr:DoxX family membrane protein [Kribbella sp. VKM Ac-2568]TCM46842.1 DoxX-like protein [Kribbella sp. VKM Ac-2568]
MTTHQPTTRLVDREALSDPGYQAFLLLRTVFTVAPVLFGLDKFANLLTDWPQYLAPWINDIVPGSGQDAMYVIGVVEIVAGVAVALIPRYGALIVAAWLAGIIVNLLTIPDFYDVALRDFGLLVGALALSRLAAKYAPARHSS